VGRAVYADFLARWQHLHPTERLSGDGSLVRSHQQLRALPVSGRVWERDIWPGRLDIYQPAELESLCQSGEVVWIGAGGADPKRSRIRFIFRAEGHIYLESPGEGVQALSPEAQSIYELLQSEGALFWADLQAALSVGKLAWNPAVVENALIELVLSGWVTNDSLQAMRYVVNMGSAKKHEEKPLPASILTRTRGSSLLSEAQLRKGQWGLRRPGPAGYRAAKRRVAERLGMAGPLSLSVGDMVDHARLLQMGRWSLVRRLGIMGRPLSVEDIVAIQARQLLQRWGVVTRHVLDFEEGAWQWEAIMSHLKLMEMRGEVRRGYFVDGLPGAQFAAPEAVERLRALRDGAAQDDLIVVNACDPANLYGPEAQGGPMTAAGQPLVFARLPSTWQVQWRGLPVLVARANGTAVTTARGADDEMIQRALRLLLDHLGKTMYRLTVKTWNGQPVLDGSGRSILESLGFYRDYPAMTWERR